MMPVAEPALLVTVNASPSVTDSAPLAPAIDIPVASPPAVFTVTAAPLPVAALAAVVIVTSVPSCVVIPGALAPVLARKSDVWGRRVCVGYDLGSGRTNKKK